MLADTPARAPLAAVTPLLAATRPCAPATPLPPLPNVSRRRGLPWPPPPPTRGPSIAPSGPLWAPARVSDADSHVTCPSCLRTRRGTRAASPSGLRVAGRTRDAPSTGPAGWPLIPRSCPPARNRILSFATPARTAAANTFAAPARPGRVRCGDTASAYASSARASVLPGRRAYRTWRGHGRRLASPARGGVAARCGTLATCGATAKTAGTVPYNLRLIASRSRPSANTRSSGSTTRRFIRK